MDAQLHALPTLAVLARTVSGCLHSAFFGLGSGSGLLTRPSLRPQLFRARPRARHLETFGPPEDEGRERPHRIGNKRHEELMRKMRAEKNKDGKKLASTTERAKWLSGIWLGRPLRVECLRSDHRVFSMEKNIPESCR
jgi:hypothetical protein